jgi:raffinose/stachyose/melibiose transport system permease protein
MRRGLSRLERTSEVQAYLMLLPSFLGTALFVIYPLLWVIRWCLYKYDGTFTALFLGPGNFLEAFRDMDFWRSVLNTFILAFGKLSIELPLALVLAVILNSKLRARNAYRVIFFLPAVISDAIIGVVFAFIFASYNGVANNLLRSVGLLQRPISWFSDRWLALGILGLASIWQNFGINMIFFLTGLQSIPQELYECAELDGASKRSQFFHITIPMLGPVLQIVIMLASLGSLKITELVLVLTGGRPAGTTEVMMTFVYKRFFTLWGAARNYGYASALALIAAAILGVMTFFYLRYTNKQASIY